MWPRPRAKISVFQLLQKCFVFFTPQMDLTNQIRKTILLSRMLMQHRNGLFSYVLVPDTPLPNSSPYIVWCVPSTYQDVLYCSSHSTVYSGWTNFRPAGTQQLPFLQNCFFLPCFTHILPIFKKLSNCLVKVYSSYHFNLQAPKFDHYFCSSPKDCIPWGYEPSLVPYSSLVL